MYEELIKQLKELGLITEFCGEQRCFECKNKDLCDEYENKTLSDVYKNAADAIERLELEVAALQTEAGGNVIGKEYIEREAAVAALEKALFAYEDETETRFKEDPDLDLTEWFFHRIFVQVMNGRDKQAIIDLPAADVRPVVRGKWEYNPGDNIPYCSECMMPQDSESNYCPNCGAKMEGKE